MTPDETKPPAPEPCKSRYQDAGLMQVSAELARQHAAEAARRRAEAAERRIRDAADSEGWDMPKREER
jgi:hypothetical protein